MSVFKYVELANSLVESEKKHISNIESYEAKVESLKKKIQKCEQKLEKANERLFREMDKDEPDYEKIYEIETRISNLEASIERAKDDIDTYEEKINDEKTEYDLVIEQKQTTLSQIHQLQDTEEENIQQVSGAYGDFADIGRNMMSALIRNQEILSEAAGILGDNSQSSYSSSFGGSVASGSSTFTSAILNENDYNISQTQGNVVSGNVSTNTDSGEETNLTQSQSGNSSSAHEKRTPTQTEEFTRKLLEKKGYIDGNKFSFMKVSMNGQSVLCSRQGSPKGYQKPDKYKLDENSGTLYIVEDKNYSIENGISSVLDSMVNQAENRIRNCLNVTVPQGLMNNSNESYIKNLVISFSLDVHGHYFHKDGSPVLVSEFLKRERAGFFKGKQTPRKYSGLSQKIQQRLLKRFSGDESKLDNVYIRVGLLFGNLTNKNLDASDTDVYIPKD